MKNNQFPLIVTGLFLTVLILIDLLFLQVRYLSTVIALLIIAVFVFLYYRGKAGENISSNMQADTENVDTEQEIQMTLSKISTFLSQQVNVVDTEIDRASTLIKDATEGLSESFKHLKRLSNASDFFRVTIASQNHLLPPF